ncbi:YjbH domain-containing protein [Amylibacter sp. SFDW26]|uniref:YjbH domain-containing protein n=1 Tax=Amylibacter sp. SFDW26 TaxID=2652722 RepID=UPI001261FC55|nr:YjbH domain-containing protein [Amylibacter sp. SFDW26]KAB7609828.1 YjbH domain-containing protein [Amylibacter sp. SFDW26]
MHFYKVLFTAFTLTGTAAFAAEPFVPTINTYGVTGLIDTPTAESQPDAELSTTISYFSGATRNTLTFQVLPRLSGSFRYSRIGQDASRTFDRSFDLRYQALDETKYRPAVTIGLQDFLGTGLLSGEYIVATKTILPSLKATAGIGWGRLGGLSGGTNRSVNFGVGGTVDTGNFFRGDTDFFGGIEWKTPIKGLNFKVERSSDFYIRDSIRNSTFTRESQINFGLDYQLSKSINLSAHYLYGSEFGLQATFSLNPKESNNPSGLDAGPLPVLKRPDLKLGQRYDTSWTNAQSSNALRKPVADILKVSDINLEAIKVTETTATVYIENKTYEYEAQAIGRTARALTRALPASIETFIIVPVSNGLPLQAITINRSNLEKYENDPAGSERLLVRTKIRNAEPIEEGTAYKEGLYPKFRWNLRPAVRSSFFDPDDPIRLELGLRARASYTFSPGISVSTSVLKPLVGNLDGTTRLPNSALPNVRSNSAEFFRQGDPVLERLTADYLFKLSPEVYGRASAGYLESQFGGVSGEVLWRPYDRNFAIGAELNYVKQRNFDQLFGFQDYSIATGHISLYRDLWNGFTAQIDAGRYLAGDYGGTLSMKRTFTNGWELGAFMTLTDVPFSQFGEGSFDKGLTLSIPFSNILGNSSRRAADLTIRPILRDGGARLNVSNRLFNVTSDYDKSDIDDSFGRFWR